MEYEHGGPVAGGTFPAEIFHDFMSQWIVMRDARRAARRAGTPDQADDTSTYIPPTTVDPNAVPDAEQGAAPTTPSEPDSGGGGGGGGQPEASPQPAPAPDESAPAPSTPAEPTLPPATPPSGGSGGGGVAPGQP
jgi:penicillin-binding protein 1A